MYDSEVEDGREEKKDEEISAYEMAAGLTLDLTNAALSVLSKQQGYRSWVFRAYTS